MFDWLFLLIAYLPLQIALNPFEGVDLASVRVFILLFFLLWLLQGFVREPIKLKLNRAAIAILGFLLISFMSVIFAANQEWGFRKFLFFGSMFPLFFLAQHLIRGWQRKIRVVWAMVIGALLVALAGLGQFIAQFYFSFEELYHFWGQNIIPVFCGFNLGAMIMQYPSWYVDLGSYDMMRAFSIYADPHMLAFYLGLTLPLSIALCLITKKKWLAFVSVLLFLVLVLTFTRGSYMAVIVALSAMAFFLWRRAINRKAALLLALAVLIFFIGGTPASYRFYTIFNFNEESNVGRLDMWQQATDIGKQNLLSGVGLGNYSIEVNPELGYRNPTTAHNLYLDVFSEMGIIALFFWLLLVAGSLWLVLKRIKTLPQDSPYLLLYLGFLGSLLYYAIHSIFETSIYQPVILGVFLVILGLIYAQESAPSPD